MLRPQFLKCSLFAAAAMLAMACGQANADLIINGDFSNTTTNVGISDGGADSNHTTNDEIDQGWSLKGGHQVIDGTNFTWNGGNAGLLQDSFAQINTISESGSQLTFSFDWTPVSASNLSLAYDVVAFNVVGTPGADIDLFRFINSSNSHAVGGGGFTRSMICSTVVMISELEMTLPHSELQRRQELA